MPSKASTILSWLLGALALLAIGILTWRLLSVPQEAGETSEHAKQAIHYASVFDQFKGIKVGDVDMGELAAGAVIKTHSSLLSVKDEATAITAQPELNLAASQFNRLTVLLGQISPETRNAFAKAFASIKPNLDQLLDKTLAIPSVRGRIKPMVDKIRSELNMLAAA